MKFIKTYGSVLLKTVFALLLWKIAIIFFAIIAEKLLPFQTEFTPFISEYARRFPYLVGIWGNFDGMHYLSIARHGYESLKQAFFPLYPITIWIGHSLFNIPYLFSALLVSHFFFLLTIPLLFVLTKKDGQPNWFFFLAVLLFFPTSFFYGAVYNDSLFFFLATSSIYFSRNRKWFWGSLLAGLATLCRLNGLALAVYFFLEYLISTTSIEESWSFKRLISEAKKKLRPAEILSSGIFWALLIPLAFIGYLAYIQYQFGDWMTLFNSMRIWKQSTLTFPPVVVWRYFKILTINQPTQLNFWVAALELLSVVFYCHVLLVSIKKIRLSYWFFILTAILIPWVTGTFQGMPRYGLHLYPFFLACSLLLSTQSKWLKASYFIISVLILIFILTLFTRGYFVA